MTYYMVDNSGREFVSSAPMGMNVSQNMGMGGNMTQNIEMNVISNSNIFKSGAFSQSLESPMVELPRGSLFKLLGKIPSPMCQGELWLVVCKEHPHEI